MMNEEQAALYIKGLANRDTRIVSAMALCLTGEVKYLPAVTGSMAKMTWDEVEDWSNALRGFGRAAVPYLIPVAHLGKKAPAACAMRALGMIGGPEAAEALAERMVALPSKAEAAEALVSMGAEAVPILLPLTAHPQADVREMAAFALGKIGDRRALQPLAALEEADRSEKVRDIARRAGAWLRGEEGCGIDLRQNFGDIPE